jgi:hypothetical protein
VIPAGVSMPTLGDRAFVDVTDEDTPNIRMPVRMLSVDTPEVTARTAARAAVKSAGVVFDSSCVIFLFGQALSAGMVSVVVASAEWFVLSGTGVSRARARTSRPR